MKDKSFFKPNQIDMQNNVFVLIFMHVQIFSLHYGHIVVVVFFISVYPKL